MSKRTMIPFVVVALVSVPGVGSAVVPPVGELCILGERPVLCEPPAQCEDGVNNDGDAWIDYPDDPGCSSPSDDSESDNPACSDGGSNDGDGRADYPNDPGCSSIYDDSECNYWAFKGAGNIGTYFPSTGAGMDTSAQVSVWWRADGYSCPGGIIIDRVDYRNCYRDASVGWATLSCIPDDPPGGAGVTGTWECTSSACAGLPSPHGLRTEFFPKERWDASFYEQFECKFYKSTNIPDQNLDSACFLMDVPTPA